MGWGLKGPPILLGMVGFDDIVAAHDRIRNEAHRTPVLTSRTLDERLGCSVFIKAESFQRSGSFKFRGAFNALSKLSDEERSRGVLTYSSGNHAQALALAGKILGVSVTVVMPFDAPHVKRAATEGYGGEVVMFDKDETTREALGRQIQEERGLTLIPPYDHLDIVAGQGTVAKELLEEVPDIDVLVVCVGGGGLLSGCALATRAMSPGVQIYGVEPEAGDDICRSMKSGKIETVFNPETIADGARTPSASELTFGIIRANVDEVLTVPDSALVEVTHFCFTRMKAVIEPTGALALAALWTGRLKFPGQRVGVVVSGGNVDISQLVGWWSAAGLD